MPPSEAKSTRTISVPPKVGVRAGSALLGAFVDQNGHFSAEKAAEGLGLTKAQFAETIGLSKGAFYRESRLSGQKTLARAKEMLEIVGRIVPWAGGEQQALAWYRAEPLPAFGGRTAESLLKEGKAAAVRDFLDHVATGGFA